MINDNFNVVSMVHVLCATGVDNINRSQVTTLCARSDHIVASSYSLHVPTLTLTFFYTTCLYYTQANVMYMKWFVV